MTTLERWATEYSDQYYFGTNFTRHEIVDAFMAGYNLAVKHASTPKEKCPPEHNCPDCGSSIVEGITD